MRRAYLCGRDRVSGENFDHRKPWVVERLRVLSSVFAIDVCAFAVMSNHLHVVLHVDRERAQDFGAEEVVERSGYAGDTPDREYGSSGAPRPQLIGASLERQPSSMGIPKWRSVVVVTGHRGNGGNLS